MERVKLELTDNIAGLDGDWRDYAADLRGSEWMGKLFSRDNVLLLQYLNAHRVAFSKFWQDSIERSSQLYFEGKDYTRAEVLELLARENSWLLDFAGLQDGHSFYFWRYVAGEGSLGFLTVRDRLEQEVLMEVLTV